MIRNEKGIALAVTLIYLIIIFILCVSALLFSVGHYKLITQRIDRAINMYLAEGGLYLGLTTGRMGDIYIKSQKVTISQSGGALSSKRSY